MKDLIMAIKILRPINLDGTEIKNKNKKTQKDIKISHYIINRII
jgi:hypothetical protein